MLRVTFSKRFRIVVFLFCFVLFCSIAIPAYAATGVPQEVLDAVDSVVFINNSRGSGTGFIIKNESGEALIATNNHVVCDDLDGNYVWLSEQEKVPAEVIFAVPEKDLSVIRIKENTEKNPVVLVAEDARRGDAVYAVGFPGASNDIADGIAHTSEDATVTDGIIGAVRSQTKVAADEAIKVLQINVAITFGNSGGPLFNEHGQVVGINAGGSARSQNVNYAIAVSELLSLLKEYDIDIPAPAKLEVTEPVIPETTAPAVPETTEPAPDTTEVTDPGTPPEPVREPGMILVICGAAVVGAVALSLLLAEEKKKAKKKKPVMKKKRKPIIEEDPVDGYIVKPKLPDEVVIEMTPSRKKSETAEKDPSSEDYFKGIKL